MENQESQNYDDCLRALLSPRHIGTNLDQIDDQIKPIVKKSIDSLFTNHPRGLILIGDVGCGKTSVLSVIIKEYIKRHFANKKIPDGHPPNIYANIKMVTHAELISKLRSENSENERVPPIAGQDWKKSIILIDDLGRGYDDKLGWNQTLQDEFFDFRWKNILPTFISTNYNKEELRSWPGWERIVDRIADPNWLTAVVVPGESRRKG